MDIAMPAQFDQWVIIHKIGNHHRILQVYQDVNKPDVNKSFGFHDVDKGIPSGTLVQGDGLTRYWLLQLRICYPDYLIEAYLAHAYLEYVRGDMELDELETNYKLKTMNYKKVIELVTENMEKQRESAH